MMSVFLFDVYPWAVRRARSPVAISRIIVVVLTDLNKKWNRRNRTTADATDAAAHRHQHCRYLPSTCRLHPPLPLPLENVMLL
jgi:hypothetical protein